MKKDVNVVKEFVSHNKIFTATFIKKDGSVRVMNCRRGVKKGVKGVGMSYDPYQKNLLPVYDMQKGAFRMINISTIQELKSNKQTISFND
jgi:hypothetical protein